MLPQHYELKAAIERLGFMNSFHIFELYNQEELDVLLWCEKIDWSSRIVHYRNTYLLFEGRDWTQEEVSRTIDAKIREIDRSAAERLVRKIPR